jgi:subtilisin family serine protease
MKSPHPFARWLVAIALALSTTTRATTPAPEYVEGEVVVRFRASETLATAKEVVSWHGLVMAGYLPWLSAHQGQVIGLLRSPTLSTSALLAELRLEPAIATAKPNYLCRLANLRPPKDQHFGQMWGLQNTGQTVNGTAGTPHDDISFRKAWGLARPTTNEIVVVVVDTGIDTTHPDLLSNLWTNPGEIPGNGVDDDGNGYVDDVHGYDFPLGTGTLTDEGYHGTHVAGTIAASGNNGIGVIGVDFQARLMVIRAASEGRFPNFWTIAAVDYAAMMKTRGVNIVALNGSYGGIGSWDDLEITAIQAAGDVGIICCFGAGNDHENNDGLPFYPASYRLPNMIAVAASDQNDALASFSNYGATTVDLAAPGVNILSCIPAGQAGMAYVQQSTNVFSAISLEYSGATPHTGITGAIHYCGLGYPTDFPTTVSNNIALIQRGDLYFSEKVANAMAAGARAAILFNNVPGNMYGTLGFPTNWIPSVFISQADGQTLQTALPAAGTVVNGLYQFFDGTSMATPHVSGAVAFAARNFPNDTVQQRIQRILANVTPVPALAGKVATGGRLNLARIVDSDDNGLPDWWELQYFSQLTGTDPNADPDGDGASNLAEFLAGTNPTNFDSALRLSMLPGPDTNLVTLQWPSAAGRYYRLLRATNLLNGFDSIVQTNLIAAPPLNSATDAPPANADSTFYRLQLEP